MKKMRSLFIILSLIMFGLSSLEAKPSKSGSTSEKRGRQVKDHDGNDWPDWGKLD